MKKTLSAALAWVLLVGVAMVFPLSSAHATETFAAETEMRQYTASAGVEGYILFNGASDPRTYSASPTGTAYLIDRQGYKYKEWTGVSFGPRLLEDGRLWSVGQIQSWDGTVEWQYTPPAGYNIHHEGLRIWNKTLAAYTYLMLFNYTADSDDLIAAGVGNATASVSQIDGIMEVNENKQIVWEWRFLDHVCQSQNAAWNNYESDVSSDTWTKRCNLFYKTNHQIQQGGTGIENDWHHATSIDYNETLDHIVINSRNWSEVYVIDHGSTFVNTLNYGANISAAAGPAGDFLWRFGNAGAYDQANWVPPEFRAERMQQLFGPDQVTWLGNEWTTPHAGDSWAEPVALPTNGTGDNHLLIFNNNIYRAVPQSWIVEVNPFSGSTAPDYSTEFSAGYGSGNYRRSNMITYTYASSGQWQFFTKDYSAVQRLTNGGLFLSCGDHGSLTQANSGSSTGGAVWEYIVPMMSTATVAPAIMTYRTDWLDGDNISPVRARFYRADFPGFSGKTLTQGSTITGNPLRPIGGNEDPGFSCGSCSSACDTTPSSDCPVCDTCVECNSCCTTCTPNTDCAVCPECDSCCDTTPCVQPDPPCTICPICNSCCGDDCVPRTDCEPCVTDCPVCTDCPPTSDCPVCDSCCTDYPCTPRTDCVDDCPVCDSCCTDYPCTPNTNCPECVDCDTNGGCCDGETCAPNTDCLVCVDCSTCCPDPCITYCDCYEVNLYRCEKTCGEDDQCPFNHCPEGPFSCCALMCPEVPESPLQAILGGWGINANACPACPCGVAGQGDNVKPGISKGWGATISTPQEGGSGGSSGGAGGGGSGGY